MPDFVNVLENPTLDPQGIAKIYEFHDLVDGVPHPIYSPPGWDVQAKALKAGSVDAANDNPNAVNSVVPRTDGNQQFLAIEVNNRPALTRFIKMGIPTRPGQRYLVKVVAKPDVAFASAGDETSLRFRVTYVINGDAFPQAWHNDWNVQENSSVLLELIQCQSGVEIGLSIDVWNVFGNLTGNVFIKSIEMLEVPQTYGDRFFYVPVGSLPYVTTPADTPPVVTPPPATNPPPVTPPSLPVGFPTLYNPLKADGQVNWQLAIYDFAAVGAWALARVAELTKPAAA